MSEQSARIFIVEDEALIQMEIADRLTRLGYTVCGTAARGEAALEQIPVLQPHLVIMDINLAGKMNGMEAAARLHETGGPPVLFLTAYSDSELLKRAMKSQPYGYLVKPFEERELHAMIQAALAKHSAVTTLSETNARLDEEVRERTALLQAQARLSDVLEMSPDGIIMADETGNITLFNTGAQAIFGYRADEMIGRGIDCLMPERYRAAHGQHMRAFVALPNASRKMGSGVEIVGLRKNGQEFPIQASLSKVSTSHGVTLTTIMRDISEEKAARQELMNAKSQAEEANKAKSTFIANMSHELRTPLNAILGFSELLSSGGFAGKSEEYGKLIYGSGRHLLSLVNDILDLAKIEAGRWTLNEAIVDFGQLAMSCCELVAGNANTSRISLTADMAKDLPFITADERALKQILLNLLSNARKFTRAGGEVVIFARLEANGEFAFGVRDTGTGITEDDQERVFDSFGQGRHDAVRVERGTGLGLPIVKGLALVHGGRVALQSKIDVGTCVTVFLPPHRVQQLRALKTA